MPYKVRTIIKTQHNTDHPSALFCSVPRSSMNSDENSEFSSDEGALGGLFRQRDDSKDVFYFKGFNISNDSFNAASVVCFQYAYNREVEIRSYLHVPYRLCESSSPMLACVGMSILPWYWMGYGTPKIIVEADCVSREVLEFFNVLYTNCFLEYCERNGVATPDVELCPPTASGPRDSLGAEVTEAGLKVVEPVDIATTAVQLAACHHAGGKILVPLGGELRRRTNDNVCIHECGALNRREGQSCCSPNGPREML